MKWGQNVRKEVSKHPRHESDQMEEEKRGGGKENTFLKKQKKNERKNKRLGGRTEEQLLSCLALKWASNSWFALHMSDGHFLSEMFKKKRGQVSLRPEVICWCVVESQRVAFNNTVAKQKVERNTYTSGVKSSLSALILRVTINSVAHGGSSLPSGQLGGQKHGGGFYWDWVEGAKGKPDRKIQ